MPPGNLWVGCRQSLLNPHTSTFDLMKTGRRMLIGKNIYMCICKHRFLHVVSYS